MSQFLGQLGPSISILLTTGTYNTLRYKALLTNSNFERHNKKFRYVTFLITIWPRWAKSLLSVY